MKKEVTVCDGCERIIKKFSDIYKIDVKTGHFWDGVETVQFVERLEFCPKCARELKETLKRLVEKLEKKG